MTPRHDTETDFLRGYLECAEWLATDPEMDGASWSPEFLAEAAADCARFVGVVMPCRDLQPAPWANDWWRNPAPAPVAPTLETPTDA